MLTREQRLLAARHLSPRTGDELQTATVTLSKRQLAFIVEAIENFEAQCCPLKGGTQGCQLLTWFESPATGAIETVCADSCLTWRDALIERLAPEAFPVS